MRTFTAIFTLLILTAFAGMAQNRATIKGKVIDSASKQVLEFATVALVDVKDSSLISYTVTTKTGEFALHSLPVEKPVKLVISFVGYQNFRKELRFNKGDNIDLGAIKLNGRELNEVKIRAEVAPVIIKKDTIEFNAEAFKTPPNAVVEELLKRLPGLQVDMDGTITMGGKAVSKLLIDGKEFFANDPKIASKNLDANLIDKVQIYDDRENDPDHLIPDSKVSKIVNLKFKKAIKKSSFGKIRGGGGTRDRFDGGLLYNMFRDTLQISAIGIGNNLNRTGFSTQDLMTNGGFDRSGGDALNNGNAPVGGQGYGGIQTIASGGLNINTDYGKKLKLNLLYFYSYTADVSRLTLFSQQFFGDTTLSTAGSNYNKRIVNKHNISGLIHWKPDTIAELNYRPNLSLNNNTAIANSAYNSFNNNGPLNNSLNNGSTNGNSTQFRHSFTYYRKLHKKGESINIAHDLNISPGTDFNYATNDLVSFTTALNSTSLRRLADNTNNNVTTGLNITYRYPFTKKLTGSITASGNYTYSKGRRFTYDQNLATGQYTIYIDSLSRDLRRHQYTETAQPELTYNFSKSTILAVGLGLQNMQTNNQFNKPGVADINRRELFLLPTLRFNIINFSVNYNTSIRQPSITDMLPFSTVYSQLYTSVGNPDLKATRTHNATINYNKYISESQLWNYINFSASLEENSIFLKQTISSQGAKISKPINKDGQYNLSFNYNVNKTFKKAGDWQLGFNAGLGSSLNHSYFQVNNVEGFQNRFFIYFWPQLNISWQNKIELRPAYTINLTSTSYQNLNYNTLNYASQKVEIPAVIRWPKHTTIEANYQYSYNPLVAAGFQRHSNLLNLAVARQIQKGDRGEIRLSCYDIFDQNINSYRYANANSIGDTQNEILKRYFLITYAYRFNKTTTKK
jgi:hypothetical protein